MTAKSPTAAEKKWLKDLEEVLARCPSPRLAAYANAGSYLGLYDQEVLKAWQDTEEFKPGNRDDTIYDQIRKSRASIGIVSSPFKIVPA